MKAQATSDMVGSRLSLAEWTLGGFTLLMALAVWLQFRQPLSAGLGAYDLFPLFGLVAFGMMWVHFISGALKRYWDMKGPSTSFDRVSMYVVLVSIIMHPTLMWLALWRDDFGLPPMSQYLAFGGTVSLNIALFVGMIALNIFLIYELKRWLGGRKWWKYVEWLQLPAMALIFFHALSLGGELGITWYLVLWWAYGATLAIAASYTIYNDVNTKREAHEN